MSFLDSDNPRRKQAVVKHLKQGGAIIVSPTDLDSAFQAFAALNVEVPIGTSVTMIQTQDGKTMVTAEQTPSEVDWDNV